MVPRVVLDERADVHPLRTRLDLTLGLELFEKHDELLTVLSLLPGPGCLVLLASIIERPLQSLDMVFKGSQYVTFGQRLELLIALELVVRMNHFIGFSPAGVRLKVKRAQNVSQFIQSSLALHSFLVNVSLFERNNVLIEELASFFLLVRRPESGLSLNDRANSLPTAVVLDFGVALQHGVEICAELGKSFFRSVLFLHANIDRIFLESCFAVSRVLECAELRVFNSRTHGLLPSPVGLHIVSLEQLHEGAFCLLEGMVIRVI